MRIIPTTLGIIALAILSVATASAQEKSARKEAGQSNSSSTATKSRARRVSTKAPDEPSSSTSNQTPKVKAPTENEIEPAAPTTDPKEEQEEPSINAGGRNDEGSREKAVDSKSIPQDAVIQGTTNPPDSLVSLRNQIEVAPNGSDRIRLQLKLSEHLVAAGKKVEATQELRTIINAEVFDPQGFYNAGNALARLGQADEAINAYRKAINQRKGNYSRALNNLGVILLRQGKWDEAHDALLSALKLESFRYAEASYNLGRLYSARGESDMATREWRRTLSIDPEHPAAARALSLGSPEGVIVRREGSAKAPKSPARSTSIPELSANNIKPLPRLEKNSVSRNSAPANVLTLDPVRYEFLQRARNLRERGKHQKAVEDYRSILARSHGYFPLANLELSYSLLMLNRTDEALANLSQVANRDGASYPIAYYHLARLYEAKGNLKEAEEFFSQAAIAYKSTNSSFLLDLSRVRERRGNFKGALAAMEEYVTEAERQGLKPAWVDQSLTALREKASAEPK